jgi:hypothetical protein
MKTKRLTIVDKTASVVTKSRGGRPPLGDKPLTKAERQRRYRENKRRANETDEERGKRNAREALQSLCASRGIREGTSEYLIASRWVNAMAENAYGDAIRLMDMLPPRIKADVTSRVVGSAEIRDKMWELYCNAVAADQVEEAREIDRLRAENAALRARLAGEQAVAAPILPATGPVASGGARPAITPSIGDITPPSERCDLPQNQRMGVYPDDAKLAARRNAPVIDATPVPVARETVPGEWDASPTGRAWHEYRRTHPTDEDVLLW